MLEATRKDILHPEKKPQRDGRRGTIKIKIKPQIQYCGWPHKLEYNYTTVALPLEWSSESTSGSPAWGSGNGKKSPRKSLGQTCWNLWISCGDKIAVARSRDKDTGSGILGTTHWCEPSWGLPFSNQDLTLPNSLQTPVLGCLRSNNQQSR